jgi:hypothetical protein
MNCREVTQLASLYASGDLDRTRASACDVHLKGCASCTQEVERQAYFDARLREIVLSEELDASAINRRVRARIADEVQSPGALATFAVMPRRWAAAAMAVAAAAVIFGLGYHLFGRRVAGVYAAAATDHRIEIVNNQPRSWFTNSTEIQALAQTQGVPAKDVNALAAGRYHLDRAKLCFLDGRVFLHLVFSDSSGKFSVYLRPLDPQPLPGAVREIANGSPLRTSESGHEHLAWFETSQLMTVVVTDESSGAALGFARFAFGVL